MKLSLDTENIDDAIMYLKAPIFRAQVLDFKTWLYKKRKYGEHSPEVDAMLDEIWDNLCETVEE